MLRKLLRATRLKETYNEEKNLKDPNSNPNPSSSRQELKLETDNISWDSVDLSWDSIIITNQQCTVIRDYIPQYDKYDMMHDYCTDPPLSDYHYSVQNPIGISLKQLTEAVYRMKCTKYNFANEPFDAFYFSSFSPLILIADFDHCI